jgi:hypothetical protein
VTLAKVVETTSPQLAEKAVDKVPPQSAEDPGIPDYGITCPDIDWEADEPDNGKKLRNDESINPFRYDLLLG